VYYTFNYESDTTVLVPVAARSKDVVLRPLACWDCGFEPRREQGCLSLVCCQVEVSATSWSLVQSSPTGCVASLCVSWKPQEWSHGTRWAAAPKKKNWYYCQYVYSCWKILLVLNLTFLFYFCYKQQYSCCQLRKGMCLENVTSTRLEGRRERKSSLCPDRRSTTEIRTKQIPNTSQNRHHWDNPLCKIILLLNFYSKRGKFPSTLTS
jgi:hypothetical protein